MVAQLGVSLCRTCCHRIFKNMAFLWSSDKCKSRSICCSKYWTKSDINHHAVKIPVLHWTILQASSSRAEPLPSSHLTQNLFDKIKGNDHSDRSEDNKKCYQKIYFSVGESTNCNIHIPVTFVNKSIISSYGCSRSLHTSRSLYKDESKVEQAVKVFKDIAIKDKKEGTKPENKFRPVQRHSAMLGVKAVVPKRSIYQRIVAEVKHYYHGFKLLFIDIKVAARYVMKMLRGYSLTRRERRQLVRTTSDLFRLVPFTVFLIVPFMEVLLPVAIKVFPNMLPSTFKEENKEQEKLRKKLKVKLELAKFLLDTLEETAITRKGAKGETVAEFATFMDKIRSTGEAVDNEEIIKYSQLFEDEITLDNLNYRQLRALCKLIDISVVDVSETVLRFQLQYRMRELEADDKMIQKEGIESLTVAELQEACRVRGMRSLGVSQPRLQAQLQQWLDLHLESKIPTSLLLLSRTLYLSGAVPTADQLKVTMTELPNTATEEAKVKISEVSGDRVDNKAKYETIKQEETIILAEKQDEEKAKQIKKSKEEKEERKKQLINEEAMAADVRFNEPEAGNKEVVEPILSPYSVDSASEIKEISNEELKDKAKYLDEKSSERVQVAAEEDEISSQDFEKIEDILETVAEERTKMRIEQDDLQELKQDVSDYVENVAELKTVVLAEEGEKVELEESKAAQRLRQTVNSLIVQMDNVIGDLTKEKEYLIERIEEKETKVKYSPELLENDDRIKEVLAQISKEKQDLISINELVLAIRRIQKVPHNTKLQQIAEVLDTDQDGVIDIKDALKVIELLGKENVKINAKEVSKIVNLLQREQQIEQDHKEQKLKEKQVKENQTNSEQLLSKQQENSGDSECLQDSDNKGKRVKGQKQ